MSGNFQYLINPAAPLVVRSGVPFGSGVKPDGANFPLPSAIAGMVRTTVGIEKGLDFSSEHVKESLLAIQCKGPFLVTTLGGERQVCLPKPSDCYFVDGPHAKPQLIRLTPAELPEGAGCDLPPGLSPILPTVAAKGKPNASMSRRYWSWPLFSDWLEGTEPEDQRLNSQTLNPPATVVRTHVAIDSVTQAAIAGKLFQTAAASYEQPLGSTSTPYIEGLAFWTNTALKGDSVCLGGERRLSRLHALDESESFLPQITSRLLKQLIGATRFRLVFLTPGLLAAGAVPVPLGNAWRPLSDCPELEVHVRAVALSRMQAISGWDLAKGGPKATRRAVPTGSVYWCEVATGLTEQQVNSLWFAAMSGEIQDSTDGFGVVVPGVWI